MTTTQQAPVFTCTADIVRDAIKHTTRKSELVDTIVDSLEGQDALAPWPGQTFTVWLSADYRRLTTTRTEELDGGVVVEYWGTTPIAYRFPAPAEIEVDR